MMRQSHIIYVSHLSNNCQLGPTSFTRSAYLIIYLSISTVTNICFQHWSFSIAGENLTVRLRKFTFSRMLRQEIGWFDLPENKVGVLTSRLSVDTTVVRWVSFVIITKFRICSLDLIFVEYSNLLRLTRKKQSVHLVKCYQFIIIHCYNSIL